MLAKTNAYSSFAVDDLDKAREFYGGTLGLETNDVVEGMLMQLELAGERQTLVYIKPDVAPANNTILNFVVDDVEATVDELTERGVSFERYDGFEQDEKGIATGPPGPTIAWFKDPAGNTLAVHSEV